MLSSIPRLEIGVNILVSWTYSTAIILLTTYMKQPTDV